MSKALKLSVIMCLLLFFKNTYAQNATIRLVTFQNLSTVDLATFSIDEGFTNQQRIFQVIIDPPNIEVSISITISWKRNENTGFQTVGTYTSENFLSRTFFNDEIGTSDIKKKSSDFSSSITKEILKIGKPSGILRITIYLYDSNGQKLDDAYSEFEFLNPTPPEIILPFSGSVIDIGSIPVMWTKSLGVSSYRVHANFIGDNESNLEQALNAGNPVVNNRDVGNITSINLRDYLEREIVTDTNIVLVVRAVVEGPGGGDVLSSTPIVFSTGLIEDKQQLQSPDPVQTNLILLSNILSGQGVDQTFLNDLISGKYSLDQLQFTDEYGNTLSFADFQNILNYLQNNPDAIISVNYISQ